VPAVQALQDAITFQTGDNPGSVLPRTFQSIVTDGTGGVSAPATETINIVEANPTVALHAANRTVGDSAAFAIVPNATVSSTETHNLQGGKLIVSLTNGTSRDQLAIGAHGKSGKGSVSVSGNRVSVNGVVVGTFSGGIGTTPLEIDFNSHATFADAQAVARSITFRSIGHFAHQTDVQFQLFDGDGGISDIASTTLTIIHGHNGGGPPSGGGPGNGHHG